MIMLAVLVLSAAFAAIDPAVTQATIGTTICEHGYTATVRPPERWIGALKRRQLASYRDRNPRHYEEDHVIPLELGGAPHDPENLRPQPWPRARIKDREETRLHRLVCRGDLSLPAARAQILRDWQGEYETYRR